MKKNLVSFPNLGYELTENALKILEARYFFRKDGKIIEKTFDMFNRVSKVISNVEKEKKDKEKYYEMFYDMLASGDFMPNTPTLLNAGRLNHSVFSGCFVFKMEDSISGGPSSIFGSIELMAEIHKKGGGTGCNFSRLRPEGEIVNSTGHIASGPVTFMGNLDEAIEAIQQGGMRRGAHMSLLFIWHPDIRKFILCKNTLSIRNRAVMNRLVKSLDLDEGGEFYSEIEKALVFSQLTNMNISVGLNSEFLDALNGNGKYKIVNPFNNQIVRYEDANEMFDLIVENAWKSGEPGIVNLHRINQDNTCPHLGELMDVNPCAEQPLFPYECCNLGSISIPRMVKVKNGKYELDRDKFENRIRLAVRFLDNVIDAQDYPIKLIEEKTKLTRKIGLGIMGFADYCVMRGVEYGGNKECVDLINEIGNIIQVCSDDESEKIAIEKGNFPAYEGSIFHKQKRPMRNACKRTIAPTGSISTIAGVSFGIEPIYAMAYQREILDGTVMFEYNQVMRSKLAELGYWNSDVEEYIKKNSSIENYVKIPVNVRNIFKTSHDIIPKDHVDVQAEFQKFFDNGVSKTINLKENATRDEVKKAMKYALDRGCKGITVFRDKSRGAQVLSKFSDYVQGSIRKIRNRPKSLHGATYEIEASDCGKIFITINTDTRNYPFEIFIMAGKAGGCLQSQCEAIGRLVSTIFRGGLGVDSVVKQLVGISCPKSHIDKDDYNKSFLSCADAVGRVIKDHFSKSITHKISSKEKIELNSKCSSCGKGPLIPVSSLCVMCMNCLTPTCPTM